MGHKLGLEQLGHGADAGDGEGAAGTHQVDTDLEGAQVHRHRDKGGLASEAAGFGRKDDGAGPEFCGAELDQKWMGSCSAGSMGRQSLKPTWRAHLPR